MRSETARKLAVSFGIGIGGGTAVAVLDHYLQWLEIGAASTLTAGLLLTVVTEAALIILAQDRADHERRSPLSFVEQLPRLREAQRRSEHASLGIANLARSLPGGGRFSAFIAQSLIESLQQEG